MKTMKHILLYLVLIAPLCFGISPALAEPAACEDPSPLRFGLIPRTNLAQQMEDHRPLFTQLEKTLGRKVVVVQGSSYGTVIEGLLAGTIDLASMGPASYALAKNRGPSITAFMTWTMQGGHFIEPGSPTYNSLLIVREDSNLRDIGDLKGRNLSLTDPASTSGVVIPRAEFSRALGKRLEEHFGRITYSGSHDRSIDALMKGYVDAAFVASEHLENAVRAGVLKGNDVRVLWRSSPIPHDPFVYRGELCPELREKIREAFLSDSPETRRMLTNLKAEHFVPITDEAFSYLQDILSQTRD
ncbi:MAG: phosphate/phosphite/phosphonate ABC transporter substrate-binding protein [Pseudomonadota bacterium]